MKKKDEGFTLIELLIVIVILGILATVVVFAVSGIRDQGDQSACETERRSVETAVEAYYAQNGAYPTPPWDPSVDPDGAGPQDRYMRSSPTYFTVGANGTLTPVIQPGDTAPVCTAS